MEKKKIYKICRDKIKRKYFLKNEIKRTILKSLIQNLNLKPIKRALAWKKLSALSRKSFLSKQTNNICLKTGRSKGVLKITNLSRHYMKQLSITGSLQNIKIKSW